MKKKITPESNALKKYGYNLNKRAIPYGHLLSLLVEEMKIEKPNLKRIKLIFNNQMNGEGKIKKLNTLLFYKSPHYDKIMNYFELLKREGMVTENFIQRVEDEFKGINLEDKIFERDNTLEKYYSH